MSLAIASLAAARDADGDAIGGARARRPGVGARGPSVVNNGHWQYPGTKANGSSLARDIQRPCRGFDSGLLRERIVCVRAIPLSLSLFLRYRFADPCPVPSRPFSSRPDGDDETTTTTRSRCRALRFDPETGATVGYARGRALEH